MEREHQTELSKILRIGKGHRNEEPAKWAEIYVEIGRLIERATRLSENAPYTPNPDIAPPNGGNLHYHGAMPCYNNPCIWCGNSPHNGARLLE